jgi:hypothetical protein
VPLDCVSHVVGEAGTVRLEAPDMVFSVLAVGLERATSPFLRVMEPQVLQTLRAERGIDVDTRVASFEALRSWKNAFTG